MIEQLHSKPKKQR